jgi:hypothetical protein
MKVLLKSFFLVLALAILSYSAIEAGAPWMLPHKQEHAVNIRLTVPSRPLVKQSILNVLSQSLISV